MSKPKNRFWCLESKQYKQRFETQQKAEAFIEWNKNSFHSKYRPKRAYWCEACASWHVTHYAKPFEGPSLTEKLIEKKKEEEIEKGKSTFLEKLTLKKIEFDVDQILIKNDGDIEKSKKALSRLWEIFNSPEVQDSISSGQFRRKVYLDSVFYKAGYRDRPPLLGKTRNHLSRIRYNLLHGEVNNKDAADFLEIQKFCGQSSNLYKEVLLLYKALFVEEEGK